MRKPEEMRLTVNANSQNDLYKGVTNAIIRPDCRVMCVHEILVRELFDNI